MPNFDSLKRSWLYQPKLQLATLFAMSAAFAIVTFTMNISMQLRDILKFWGESVHMSLYLSESATPEDIQRLIANISQQKKIASYKEITPVQALSLFKEQMASLAPDLLSDPEFAQPFPTSYRLQLREGLDAKEIEQLAAELDTMAAVDDVGYGQGWVENYSTFVDSVTTITYVLMFAFCMCGVFIVGNSIRASFSSRREEIELLELLGATQMSIRLPFVVEGAVMGFLASLFAASIPVWLPYLQKNAATSSPFLTRLLEAQGGASLLTAFLIPITGALVGMLGAWLAVRSINTGWAASERLGR